MIREVAVRLTAGPRRDVLERQSISAQRRGVLALRLIPEFETQHLAEGGYGTRDADCGIQAFPLGRPPDFLPG